MEQQFERGRDEKELRKWEDKGIDHANIFSISNVPETEEERIVREIVSRFFLQWQYRQNNCLIQAIADAAGVQLSFAAIANIRNVLLGFGVGLGQFIEASKKNVRVIMQALGLYGIVHIYNVENPNLAAAPVWVEQTQGGQNVALNINYSQDHFFASPRR